VQGGDPGAVTQLPSEASRPGTLEEELKVPVQTAEVLSAMHCCMGVSSDVKLVQVAWSHLEARSDVKLAQVVWSHFEASVDGREAAPENSEVQDDWVGSSRQLFIVSTSLWRLTRVP